MHQVIYVSSATVPFAQADLRTLLDKSRANNDAVNVSGMLVYANGQFFQVLEGPKSSVDEVYARIAKDPRHASIRVLSRADVPERDFADWTMGFVTDQGAPPMTNSEGFYDFLSKNFSVKTFMEKPGQARSLLLSFRLGNWRNAVATR